MTEKDIGKDGYTEIMRAITEAEAALQAGDEDVDPFAGDAEPEFNHIDALASTLSTAQSETEVDVMITNWKTDKDSVPAGVFANGLAMLETAKKRFQ